MTNDDSWQNTNYTREWRQNQEDEGQTTWAGKEPSRILDKERAEAGTRSRTVTSSADARAINKSDDRSTLFKHENKTAWHQTVMAIWFVFAYDQALSINQIHKSHYDVGISLVHQIKTQRHGNSTWDSLNGLSGSTTMIDSLRRPSVKSSATSSCLLACHVTYKRNNTCNPLIQAKLASEAIGTRKIVASGSFFPLRKPGKYVVIQRKSPQNTSHRRSKTPSEVKHGFSHDHAFR